MRVRFINKSLSVTCLFFDNEPHDLNKIFRALPGLIQDHLNQRHPLAFFIMLLQDIGNTSEVKRAELDDVILFSEAKTGTTDWCSKPEIVRWLDNSSKIMGLLHICRNNLVFVSRAVEMELDTWERLRDLNQEEFTISQSVTTYAEKQEEITQQSIEFEYAYTKSRKAQIDDLKARLDVQITLVGYTSAATKMQ